MSRTDPPLGPALDPSRSIGCVASHDHFFLVQTAARYTFVNENKSVTAFLSKLMSRLQFTGTVPMIDVEAYDEWLTNKAYQALMEVDRTSRLANLRRLHRLALDHGDQVRFFAHMMRSSSICSHRAVPNEAAPAGAPYFSWLSLLPRRLKPIFAGRPSRADWHATQVRAPGRARRRAAGISSPHSTQCVSPSPVGRRARARITSSLTVSSIWSCTAPSGAHPLAMVAIFSSVAWMSS